MLGGKNATVILAALCPPWMVVVNSKMSQRPLRGVGALRGPQYLHVQACAATVHCANTFQILDLRLYRSSIVLQPTHAAHKEYTTRSRGRQVGIDLFCHFAI